MVYKIYSQDGCNRCEEVKKLLQSKKKIFVEFIIHKDIDIEEVKSRFPNRNLLPIITRDDLIITGIDELREKLEQEETIRLDREL